ncbi:MAG: hypothetical protein R3D57_12430 [Hyphomicrobiaceae bacterium]
MSFELSTVIDTDRYPILDLENLAGRELLSRCHAELAESGAVNLQGFIRPDAVQALAREAQALEPLAFRKDKVRNAYFTDDDAALAVDHPLRAFFPLKMAQLAHDLIPRSALIDELYRTPALTDFIRRVLGKDALYPMADRFQALNLAYLKAGDLQPWHYDHGEFTVTLLLQAAEAGGEFEYVPRLRTPDDERFDDVKRLFAGTHPDVRQLARAAGTLTIFQGMYAMHRVTEVSGSLSRITAILSYDSKPDSIASEVVNVAIYGPRVAEVLRATAADLSTEKAS